jgi:predicted nucleic acid-binding protein
VAVAGWLIDKSALARLGSSPDAAEWASRIERGLVHISTVTRLEVGFSARSATELRGAATAELAGLTVLHVDKDFDLIAVVTGQLVERLDVTS